ncbi:MAG TPA: N-glycosylase/DNA lyase [Thermoplasmata archaeon]|nr:N-glycosylase/DNA lyase [Thermoplasmata archaeon]
MPRYRYLDVLREELVDKKAAIEARLADFREVGRGTDAQLFEELCFALLAIQSSARSSDAAVRGLVQEGLLWSAGSEEIARYLRHRTRFHNHKATYIVRARERFFPDRGPVLKSSLDRFPDAKEARAWLAAEVDGLGFKEASHFLRNLGRGDDLAILDRHILRNLLRHRVIGRMPNTLTPRRYLAIEARMEDFAHVVGISLGVLDLLWWSRQTGEIFK